MNKDQNNVIIEINGERTKLTENEIILLLEYRMADNEVRKKIQELIENEKSE